MGLKGYLLYLAGAGAILTLIARRKSFSAYPSGAFFQPAAVASIANTLPSDTEDNFVYAAWDYVGQIPYEPIASDMEFQIKQDDVLCEDCYFPTQTISRNVGNCVAKSSLLASILANKIDTSRIQILIGQYAKEGGHAWVELWRDNDWYLLESTKSPDQYSYPWMIASQQYGTYQPQVLLESNKIQNVTSAYVQSLIGCACGNGFDKNQL